MKRTNIHVSIIILCFFVTFFTTKVIASDETHSNIRKAVKFAYSLEKSMKERISSFKTKKDLTEHFKEGFSAKLSKRLATHFWNVENKKVDTDSKPILVEPEIVYVLNVNKLRGIAYFASPEILIRHWKHKKFAFIRLGLVNKHWIVYQMDTVDQIPGK